jgi:glycine/D-amino acid oxidase-like deaminating enzyme
MTALEVDVAVVGGGIVGTASAYFLAKRGLGVALVERGDIGREQSSRNWGFVRQQGRHPVELPLMMESNRIWRSLSEELETDIGWVQGGNLALASDPDRLERFEEWRELARDAGLDTVILTPDEIERQFPAVHGSYTGAMFTPSDGHANPELVSPAFARAAERLGARVITNEAVEAILVSGDTVSGVATERGTIAARAVVCAAGAFSSRLLRTARLNLPQRSVRATVARTTPLAPIIRTGVWADTVSMRQRDDGRIVFAAGARADYDLTLDVFRNLRQFMPNYWKNKTLFRFKVGRPLVRDVGTVAPWTDRSRHPFSVRHAVEPQANGKRVERGTRALEAMFPSIAPVTIEHRWAGNVDATPDAIPVIDALDRPKGLVVATGFSGHGFALGPITGRLVSELVVDGTASLTIEGMRFSRFAEGDLVPARSVL